MVTAVKQLEQAVATAVFRFGITNLTAQRIEAEANFPVNVIKIRTHTNNLESEVTITTSEYGNCTYRVTVNAN